MMKDNRYFFFFKDLAQEILLSHCNILREMLFFSPIHEERDGILTTRDDQNSSRFQEGVKPR